MSGPIRSIAIAGDGIAGWLAAAAFVRRLPGVALTLVPVAGLAPAMADVFGGTPPSAGDFHADIGLHEIDAVLRTGSSYRLGTRFRDWSPDGDFVHSYSAAGPVIEGAPFATLWAAARRAGQAEPADAYQIASLLGRQGRFLPAGAVNDPLFCCHGHGLQLRPDTYRGLIASYARHLGARLASAPLRDVAYDAHGVAALTLEDGGRLEADLYVDTTNSEARLIGSLSPGWESWSHWLPCDSILTHNSPAHAELPSLDTATAIDGGWHLCAALPDRQRHALVYDRAALDDQRATQTLVERAGGSSSAPMRFSSGRRSHAWAGNVVAIGEAALVLEPLEAVPMHILFAQLDRIVTTLPDRSFAAVELAHYNRESAEEADRLRDMLIAHYHLADRPEPFWRARQTMVPPPLLAETLALFGERGRLPVRDRESFGRESWLSVLHGHGLLPRRLDAIAAGVDPGQAARIMEQYRQQLGAAAARAPSHRAFLNSLAKGRGA